MKVIKANNAVRVTDLMAKPDELPKWLINFTSGITVREDGVFFYRHVITSGWLVLEGDTVLHYAERAFESTFTPIAEEKTEEKVKFASKREPDLTRRLANGYEAIRIRSAMALAMSDWPVWLRKTFPHMQVAEWLYSFSKDEASWLVWNQKSIVCFSEAQFDVAFYQPFWSSYSPALLDKAMDIVRGARGGSPDWKAAVAKLEEEYSLSLMRPRPLTFAQFRAANLARLPLYKNKKGQLVHSKPDGSDWGPERWLEALLGELGEYANWHKKFVRGDIDEATFKTEAAKELADVHTYLDILELQFGFDAGDIIKQKFNEVSDRVGCNVKL